MIQGYRLPEVVLDNDSRMYINEECSKNDVVKSKVDNEDPNGYESDSDENYNFIHWIHIA